MQLDVNRLNQTLLINKSAQSFVSSINARAALITILKNEKSPLAEIVESIQHDEIMIVSGMASEWSTKPIRCVIQPTYLHNVVINCRRVRTFDQVKAHLTYVDDNDHYGIKIGGHLIHGNVGNVQNTKNPEKIKNCKIKNCKIKNCQFYHDPLEYGGTERRNFIKDQYTILTDENISRFADKIMYDLLRFIIYKNQHP
jgi:hypothetical protein